MNYINLKLGRLQPRFEELVRNYMRDRNLNQGDISSLANIEYVTLSRLLTRDRETGEYVRTLTALYVMRCIEGGLFNMDSIYDNAPESIEEKLFWESLADDQETLSWKRKLRKEGVDANFLMETTWKKLTENQS